MSDIFSNEAYKNITLHSLFIQPYKESKHNFQNVCIPNITFGQRFKHILVATCLLIPIINIVAFLILRAFSFPKDSSINSSSNIDKIDESKNSFENSLARIEELHFNWEDIDKLAKRKLGLRHVSTPEEFEKEFRKGVLNGCSLSITPQESRLQEMNERSWKEITVNDRDAFAEAFEKGVDEFIGQSLTYDKMRGFGTFMTLGQTRVEEVAILVNTCRFSLIDYEKHIVKPTDLDSWGKGLGRYPKDYIHAKRITQITPVKIEDLGFSIQQCKEVITKEFQGNLLCERMIICFRNSLIRTLRLLPSN